MIKKRSTLLYGKPGYGKQSVVTMIDTINEMAAQKHQAEESKKFGHFLDTGEVLPAKSESEYKEEALAELTSIVRPGPLNLNPSPTKKP